MFVKSLGRAVCHLKDLLMNQKIVGFHKDFENHWVAEMECGHGQHVRHDPPWTERPWVVSEEGRQSRLGHELNCVRCNEMGLKVASAVLAEYRKSLISAYESAGISGLCAEGRWEVALDATSTLNLPAIIEAALKPPEPS
jgi:hypothetical protein